MRSPPLGRNTAGGARGRPTQSLPGRTQTAWTRPRSGSSTPPTTPGGEGSTELDACVVGTTDPVSRRGRHCVP